MSNMLAWLTGRDDQTGQPLPLQYDDGQPSLTTYHPSPSEAFGNWLSDALGAGPGASLAHQNFAKGLPSVLGATPLGIGLSAADLIHAKAADDPMGAAAAAIGMIPAVGGEARAGVSSAKGSLQAFMKAGVPKDDVDVALSAIHEALNPGAPLPDWMKQTAKASTKPVFDYEKDDTGLYHIFDAISGKTHAVVNTPNEAKGWIANQPKNITDFDQKNLVVGPSSPYSPSIPYQDSTIFQQPFDPFPTKVPFQPAERAVAQGYVTPAIHGTKVGPSIWKTPSGSSVGESGDALRLPADELGVHFGTPDQAKDFTGNQLSSSSYVMPRTYPTVLQTGKSLELPDTGVWHVDDIKTALLDLNKGKSPGGQFALAEPKAHVGEFPAEEHANISTIEELRNYLQDKGYDSVNYINRVEGQGQRSHIMFKPSPEAPDYAAGVRSPFAAFDPSKMMRPELGLGIAGLLGAGAALSPSESKAASPRGPHINDVMDTINSVFPSTMPLPLQGTAR